MNRVDKSVPGFQKGRATAKTWSAFFFFWLCLFHGAAVVAGNLVENSSFEAGVDSRFAIDRWYIHGLPGAILDEDNPVHGRYSLKLPLSRLAYTRAPRSVDGIAFRSTEPVALQAGITYTFSAYVRSDHRLNGKLVLTSAAVGETRESVLVSKPIGVLPRWRRIFLRYTPDKNEHVYWLVRVASDDPGFLWLDALQLEAGPDLTDYRPFASVEASITTARTGKIFSSGETPEIDLRIFNNNARAQPGVSFCLLLVLKLWLSSAIVQYLTIDP